MTARGMDAERGRQLADAMRDLDELGVLQLSVEMTAEGISARAVFEKMLEGIREVDARYETGEYFIADLIMAGHILRSVMRKVLVFHGFEDFRSFGSVVIATVRGDIHDLWKNVISDILKHNGFEVEDLGADVPEAHIIEAVRNRAPDILILSGTLQASADRMAETVAGLEEAGLRQQVRIIVGGSAVTTESSAAMGADAYCAGVMDCLKACHDIMARATGEC